MSNELTHYIKLSKMLNITITCDDEMINAKLTKNKGLTNELLMSLKQWMI